MTHRQLDNMIANFRSILPDAPSPLGIFFIRHDWRPIWALSKEIQEGFSSGVRYPSREDHQAAWKRFHDLRSEANKRAAAEHEQLQIRSENHRDSILQMCKGLGWSQLMDAIFFFDRTTVEGMKEQQRRLGEAMQELKARKHEMLGEHKQQCFEKFQRVKEEQERFWSQYRDAREVKREQIEAGRAAFRSRVQENLSANRERLAKAKSALSRFEAKADELREKIAHDDASEKWRRIWGEWLEETEEKVSSIKEQIERVKAWIGEDERKLED